MAKRLNNRYDRDVLKQIIQVNKLQPGMDQIDERCLEKSYGQWREQLYK
jgi:hypothetical protein